MEGSTMTILQLKREMEKVIEEEKDDPETAHVELDFLLLKYIGNKTITDLFMNQARWYS